ncbi:UDP-3-O-acyl-N-acetylglucosamine deacetylase [Indioceanicola profundi]|uniref:UDP-3-O-acyl-N-acetylglucosamine deacetylase n=1 Tax=Indioceanicola profundi TaxID=2220096 RepID=UPI000E6AD80D|nr:UDP-3-O-acyl-N-acetylglucosamine deacetylase [Indioceanicola profundi]
MTRQRTLKAPINCTGIGLHSGSRVRMTLRPAPVDTGIVFIRTDLPVERATVPARWDLVSDTRLCTVISNEGKAAVGTVEHLMAALRAAEIDNLYVELDAPEVPIMDGSSAPFVFLIECAGIVAQPASRRVIRVLKDVRVEDGEKLAALSPAPVSSFHVEIDFASNAIRRQQGSLVLSEGAFKSEVSRARTFGFLHEVEAMRQAGLARGGSLDNAVIINGDRVMNEGGLRYADEFVRHKILDAVGDLYMAGHQILGRFQGVRPGHAMNNRLLRALFADATAWRLEDAAWSEEPLAATA